MPSAVNVSHLPRGDCTTLALLHPTPEEQLVVTKINGSTWKGPLSLETYIQREEYLANQALTRDGGITFWVLVDTSESLTPRTILASCETLRKRALIRKQNGQVEEIVARAIASVFCNPDFRGKGYAGRMVEELGKKLDTWRHEKGEKADFTILFSDIGKKFYSKHGWRPFPSSHMALKPAAQAILNTHSSDQLPAGIPLYANDLPDLCRADEAALRNRLSKYPAQTADILVALIPDVETLQWHHAREAFLAEELFKRSPAVKGAIAKTEDGLRVWCTWTRTFGNEEDGNTLNILRMVIEGEAHVERRLSEGELSTTSSSSSDQRRVLAAASVLRAAQREAAAWPMQDIQIWNPSPLATLAVKHLDPSASLVHRDSESIASLRWHGPDTGSAIEIDWIGNEKFGWC